jgi:subtilisin family serine protease
VSHHLDTPLARQNGQLYIDDLFVFPGSLGTVLVMDVNSTITGPDVQRGFHPEARYEFKVHFDGAEFETLTYRVSFGERAPDGRQALRLHALEGNEAREDAAVGALILEGRTGDVVSGDGARIWAGRIGDPFYIDLSLLSIVNSAVRDGAAADLSAWQPAKAQNSFTGTTVESIVVEISRNHPLLRSGVRTGIWCATKLATDAGGWRQINRAGHPMMWPIFWPDDTQFTYPVNDRHPSADFDADGTHIAGHIAAVVSASGTSDDAQGYGQTVARTLFPDVLPYVIGTPATYGFARRNGRTMADNAPEEMLSLALNTAVPSGLSPAISKHLRIAEFPHVVAM